MAERILIINPFGIGDVLFTTPLISSIKMNVPDAFIGYIANRRSVSVLRNNPKIDKIFIYERDEFYEAYQHSKIKFFKKMINFLQEIKKEKFGLVFDLSLNGSASFLMWFLGIRDRVGFNYKNRSVFLNRKVKLEGYEGRHVVDYYLDLLNELDWDLKAKELELFVCPKDQQWADCFLSNNRVKGSKPLIGLIPGGGASWGRDAFLKRWSSEKYAKLADKIVEKFASPIILLGDKNEVALCTSVAKMMRNDCIQACGQTTVGQFAALLTRCSVAVMNDGGPLHIAVAAGVKTISIFGPVDEKVYGPYPIKDHFVVKKDMACRPCYQRFRMPHCEHMSCLNSVTVEEVLRKVEEAL